MESHRVGHDWSNLAADLRRKIQAEDKDLGNHQHLVCNEALSEDKIIQEKISPPVLKIYDIQQKMTHRSY